MPAVVQGSSEAEPTKRFRVEVASHGKTAPEEPSIKTGGPHWRVVMCERDAATGAPCTEIDPGNRESWCGTCLRAALVTAERERDEARWWADELNARIKIYRCAHREGERGRSPNTEKSPTTILYGMVRRPDATDGK